MRNRLGIGYAVALLIVLFTPWVSTAPGHAEDADVHPMHFPVQEAVHYTDDFGAPRTGHTHEGNDLMGQKLFHELAAFDGTVTVVRYWDGVSTAGNWLEIKNDDGWYVRYMHVNNDSPNTDDGLNPGAWNFAPGITVGARVTAGQFVAYMGDSGNAEDTGPHLHFELHRPDGTAISPFKSLQLSQDIPVGTKCRFETNPKPAPSPAGGTGYWVLGQDGGVFSFGSAQFHGSAGGMRLNAPVITMQTTADRGGYWLAARDGGIFSFGNAVFYGSTGNIRLNAPVIAMAATPTGKGYWMVAEDGGVFTFGDAAFFGSTGNIRLNMPVVGIQGTRSGRGYWLVASDGGVFTFGDAHFHGSTGGVRLAAPVTSLAASPDGGGYWMVADDGGVFSFGNSTYYGSVPGSGVCAWPHATSITSSLNGRGYWVEGADGSTSAFGNAQYMGAVNALGLNWFAKTLSLVLS